MMVPARSSSARPPSALTRMPPIARMGPGSAAATRKLYQLPPISGRSSPKISTATPNSNVHSPS